MSNSKIGDASDYVAPTAFLVVIVLALLTVLFLSRNATFSMGPTTPAEMPEFLLSPALPVTPSQLELSCAGRARDITGCVSLNSAALPALTSAWARATPEQRLECHGPYPMPLRVNLVLFLRECFERTGVNAR